MQKKRLIFSFLIIFPLIVGLACRFTSKNETPTPEVVPYGGDTDDVEGTSERTGGEVEDIEEAEEPVDPGEFQELILLENSQWIQDGYKVFNAFFFENANSNVAFEDVEYTVYVYDVDGNEIGSDYSTVPWIHPDQTFGIVFTYYLEDESITVGSVNVEWTYDDVVEADGLHNPFTVTNAVYWQNDSFPVVTGVINNNDSDTYTDIRTNIICYNSAGEIVGGSNTYVDFVPGSDFMGFTSYVDVYDTVDYVEVYPTFSYSTTIYEGTDFWSNISIVDDNFFLDAYGSVHGGLEVQSNIDTVLLDSIAAVTFYDASGNVTATAEANIDILLPHETIGVFPWASYPPTGSVTESYDILILPCEYEDDYEFTENPFVVNTTTLTGDWNDYVAVNFTNTYSKQASEVDVYVLIYDADGNIIGGGSDWTSDPIGAGSTIEVEIWVDYDSDKAIDSIKAWVVPNYWTEYE